MLVESQIGDSTAVIVVVGPDILVGRSSAEVGGLGNEKTRPSAGSSLRLGVTGLYPAHNIILSAYGLLLLTLDGLESTLCRHYGKVRRDAYIPGTYPNL